MLDGQQSPVISGTLAFTRMYVFPFSVKIKFDDLYFVKNILERSERKLYILHIPMFAYFSWRHWISTATAFPFFYIFHNTEL